MKPPPFVENTTHKIYWNKGTYTDHTITANRPDIIVVSKTQNKTSLIEISVPNNNNIQKKIQRKNRKVHPSQRRIKKPLETTTCRNNPDHNFINRSHTKKSKTKMHTSGTTK